MESHKLRQSKSFTKDTSRRSSTRSIKRPKFDDELVESSLLKNERAKNNKVEISPVEQASTIVETTVGPSLNLNKRRNKRKLSKSLLSRSSQLGRWKAEDDLKLILAVQQTCDLKAVHLAVKFSCGFTLNEIKQRWHSLLYDSSVSSTALATIKRLHPDIVDSVQSGALFSQAEETELSKIPSTTQPPLERFQELLDEDKRKANKSFLNSRTAKSLQKHWLLMKQYHLLPNQTVQPLPKGDHVLNFCDAEDLLRDSDLLAESDSDTELIAAERRQKRRMRRLESEIPRWQVLVESVTGVSPPEFDNLTLAVIRGRLVRYLMRSHQITVGRSTACSVVDVDLSLEGPAWKISRRQGLIRLDEQKGEFFIENEGRRALYVDGVPVLPQTSHILTNNCVIEITCLRFIFLANADLVNNLRLEAQQKLVTQ